MTTWLCPDCESDKVVSEHHQAFYVNTCDHYCHTMKTHDDNSPSWCLACDWKGVVGELLKNREVDNVKV